jgi:hypothetical protein
MRRRLLAAITLALLAVAMPADAFHEETVPAQWSLMRVGPTGTDLDIGVGYGGCDQAPQVTEVHEGTTAVTLTVSQPRCVPDRGDGPSVCPAIARFTTLAVRLSHPLAGRSLVGQWRFSTPPTGAGGIVPRMIGARAGDAMRGLANERIHTRLIGSVDGMVIRQSPAPGQRFSAEQGITLVAEGAGPASAAPSLELPRTVRLDRHRRLVVSLRRVNFTGTVRVMLHLFHDKVARTVSVRAARTARVAFVVGPKDAAHLRHGAKLGMRAALRAPGRGTRALFHESVVR